MIHAYVVAVCFIEPELWAGSMLYIAGIRIFDFFCSCDLDLMTFIYELDSYSPGGDTPDVHI